MKRNLKLQNYKDNEDDNETIIVDILKQTLIQMKKEEYILELERDFGVVKSIKDTKNETKKSFRLTYISGIAATLLVLIILAPSLDLFKGNDNFVADYLEEDYFIHPGNQKGRSLLDGEIRTLAISSYSDRNFRESATLFNSISTKTADDLFLAPYPIYTMERVKKQFLHSKTLFKNCMCLKKKSIGI